MISILWTFLIIIGIVYSLITGNIEVINNSILTNAGKALELILSLLPTIVLWSGIMKIAEDAGVLTKFASFLKPILSKLFPSVPSNHPSLGYIASNIAANMLGLGSAATPFGLKAMSELQKINSKKDTASNAMITFLVLNTAGVTIIPTTIIALRLAYGSSSPTAIIAPAVISTSCSCISAIVIDYFIRRGKK
ncbi:MAG: nucleoside recognition domain-containing protein [bacterium]|nr:nucleoside recognition domain-containing protein [bacterium]